MQWMYINYLKRESNPNKKWNLISMSLEHSNLRLLAPRSTNWAMGPFYTSVEENNIFNTMNVPKLLKKEKVIQIKSEILIGRV